MSLIGSFAEGTLQTNNFGEVRLQIGSFVEARLQTNNLAEAKLLLIHFTIL